MNLSDLSYIWKTHDKGLQSYAKKQGKPLSEIFSFWDKLDSLVKKDIDFPIKDQIKAFYDVITKKLEEMTTEDIPEDFFKQYNFSISQFIKWMLPNIEEEFNLSTLIGQISFYFRKIEKLKNQGQDDDKQSHEMKEETDKVVKDDESNAMENNIESTKGNESDIGKENNEEDKEDETESPEDTKLEEKIEDIENSSTSTKENDIEEPSDKNEIEEEISYYVFQPQPLEKSTKEELSKEDEDMLEKELLNQENSEIAQEDHSELSSMEETAESFKKHKNDSEKEEKEGENIPKKINWKMIIIIGGIAFVSLILVIKYMKTKKERKEPISYLPPASMPLQPVSTQSQQQITPQEKPHTMEEYTKSLISGMMSKKPTRRPEDIWGRRS